MPLARAASRPVPTRLMKSILDPEQQLHARGLAGDAEHVDVEPLVLPVAERGGQRGVAGMAGRDVDGGRAEAGLGQALGGGGEAGRGQDRGGGSGGDEKIATVDHGG